MNRIAGGPAAANGEILPRVAPGNGLSVDRNLRVFRPSGYAQVECELRSLQRSDRDVHGAIPRIIRLLPHLQCGAVLKMPIELGIVIEMQIDAVTTGAVKIARQGTQCALEIWRAARDVVPLVANFVAGRGVKCQRIAITIQGSVERHSGIDAVV